MRVKDPGFRFRVGTEEDTGTVCGWAPQQYRGTSLIRSNPLLGPYSRTVSRALWWPQGWGGGLTSEIHL